MHTEFFSSSKKRNTGVFVPQHNGAVHKSSTNKSIQRCPNNRFNASLPDHQKESASLLTDGPYQIPLPESSLAQLRTRGPGTGLEHRLERMSCVGSPPRASGETEVTMGRSLGQQHFNLFSAGEPHRHKPGFQLGPHRQGLAGFPSEERLAPRPPLPVKHSR